MIRHHRSSNDIDINTIIYLFIDRPIINGKVEEKTVGEGPSLATMFEDDRHLQGVIQNIRVCVVFPSHQPVFYLKPSFLASSLRAGCIFVKTLILRKFPM